jgi:hypothetical protein
MTMKTINYLKVVPNSFEPPNILYKYRSMKDPFLQNLLTANEVYFSCLAGFNDPFELAKKLSGSTLEKPVRRDITEAGVFCLCNSNDNLPMWSYYGDGLRGIAIGYDLHLLLSTLESLIPNKLKGTELWKYIYRVRYSNQSFVPINEMNLLKNNKSTEKTRTELFARKSAAFKHEDEVRIVFEPSPTYPDASKWWRGDGLYLHSPDAIKEVILGELISNTDEQKILDMLEGRDVVIKRAVRSKTEYKITIEENAKQPVNKTLPST